MNHPHTIAVERWHSAAALEFAARQGSPGEPTVTVHQGWATSPLKLQRAYPQADGRCELPPLHTAGDRQHLRHGLWWFLCLGGIVAIT